ncbi:hypothetical protein [Acidomonas methanolica]|uniref:Chaperone CsaA export-related n=1 Tax=Acidomonas methanolica NBRC 104435 TaxID=1231351 RepID=A0A023D163_ACIMT|nr:hypothetical protein [Acidomonas methanolica]MBU2654954.1 tRNA-binding protein [Acidomonas methanolica]TCS26305.1 hypothetical protein EDC31_11538 [Acidomonas methanolica]GAJ27799.1 chaperone CsaA export-related [Acidomonas methanolica NBRC 104435]GEK99164.1 hypothetical protein AME01nite_16630 [Acidomonas methanolica NBRC 104435]
MNRPDSLSSTTWRAAGPDIRVGSVARVEAGSAFWQLWITFGAGFGLRRAVVRPAARYRPDALPGSRVCAVVNPPLPPSSPTDVIVLGMTEPGGGMILICPDQCVADGGKLF